MKLYIISQDIIEAINKNMSTLMHYKTNEYIESLIYSPDGIFKYTKGGLYKANVINDKQYTMNFVDMSQEFICDESYIKLQEHPSSRIPFHHINEKVLVKEFSCHGDSNVKLCISFPDKNADTFTKAYFKVRDKIMNYEEDLQQFLSLLNLYN